MVKHSMAVVSALMTLGYEAAAADLHTCKLSPDKKSVSVLISNPYAQETHCNVNCHLILPGSGIRTESITCGKTVPGGAKDFELCSKAREEGPYLRVDSSSNSECVKPLAEQNDDDEDDDKLADEMQKKSIEMLKSMQRR